MQEVGILMVDMEKVFQHTEHQPRNGERLTEEGRASN